MPDNIAYDPGDVKLIIEASWKTKDSRRFRTKTIRKRMCKWMRGTKLVNIYCPCLADA